LQDICKAKVVGAGLGSTEIEFHPETIKQGSYCADPRTAGSISLLLQVALPVAYFADGPITLDLKGGTNCDMAPQIDFTTEIFRPNLEKFGCSFDFDLMKRG
jgi:RNA 3'-terminal phosphate cyclase (ATP)